MYEKLMSACAVGIEGKLIEVEVDSSNGLPQMNIVGLPDSAVRESTERVRSAIRNSGYRFPMERITVNLAPAELRKEGAVFDLAMAAGILLTSRQWQCDETFNNSAVWIGELALDGTVRQVRGVLSVIEAAIRSGRTKIVLPRKNLAEATLVREAELFPVDSLREAEWILNGQAEPLSVAEVLRERELSGRGLSDEQSSGWTQGSGEPGGWVDVVGQEHAKRALQIAAAGRHHLLLIGPPGAGKTMLAKRLPALLPPLNETERLELTKLYSVANKLNSAHSLIAERPFRELHQTASKVSLIGGGARSLPGEISLAHHGILFLDELSEFPRSLLEQLRQPLEERTIVITRTRNTVRYPARFLLVATMNPCPCGYLGSELCSCTSSRIQQYRTKLSGPFLERIDLHCELQRPELSDGAAADLTISPGFASKINDIDSVRQAIDAAQRLQLDRNQGIYNSDLYGASLSQYCHMDQQSKKMLAQLYHQSQISARSHDHLLKIARTIADLTKSVDIQAAHLAEAISFRALDRGMPQAQNASR